MREEYLDADLVVDESIQKRLLDAGMDQRLAAHYAHLFIRDPLVVYDKDLEKVDRMGTRQFDIFQSTNWQTLRLKPPVTSPMKDTDTGWRVEIRPMEVQPTDFENAAFSIFVVLLARTILHFNLNLYMPIRKIDENMETAHARDAVSSRRFFFRRDILSDELPSHDGPSGNSQHMPPSETNNNNNNNNKSIKNEYSPMTINEIINGAPSSSSSSTSTSTSPLHNNKKPPGLLPLIRHYLDTTTKTKTTSPSAPTQREALEPYLTLIADRARGSDPTPATRLRAFVTAHPEYGSDSRVGEGVLHDLVREMAV